MKTNSKNVILIVSFVLAIIIIGFFPLRKEIISLSDFYHNFLPRKEGERVPIDELPIKEIYPSITDDETGEYEELIFPDNNVDTSDWQTYHNEEFGFEVRYPRGWVVKEYRKEQLQKEDLSHMYPEPFLGYIVLDSLVPYFAVGVKFYNESVEQTIERGEKEILLQGDSLPHGRMIQVNNSYGRWYPLDEKDEEYDRGIYFLGDAQSGYRIGHTINLKDSIDTKIYQQIILSFKLIK